MSSAQVEFQGLCQLINHPHIAGGLDDVISFLERGGWLHTTVLPLRRTAGAARHMERRPEAWTARTCQC
jgi:hypothetical protein